MSRRTKTLIAAIVIVFFWLPFYALLIMGLAWHVLPRRALVCGAAFLCPGRNLVDRSHRSFVALDVPGTTGQKPAMIDNKDESRFELEEKGLLVWADYRIRDGKYLLPHVEAEPPLRGTGAAGRLMQQIVDHARAEPTGAGAALSLCAALVPAPSGSRRRAGLDSVASIAILVRSLRPLAQARGVRRSIWSAGPFRPPSAERFSLSWINASRADDQTLISSSVSRLRFAAWNTFKFAWNATLADNWLTASVAKSTLGTATMPWPLANGAVGS